MKGDLIAILKSASGKISKGHKTHYTYFNSQTGSQELRALPKHISPAVKANRERFGRVYGIGYANVLKVRSKCSN